MKKSLTTLLIINLILPAVSFAQSGPGIRPFPPGSGGRPSPHRPPPSGRGSIDDLRGIFDEDDGRWDLDDIGFRFSIYDCSEPTYSLGGRPWGAPQKRAMEFCTEGYQHPEQTQACLLAYAHAAKFAKHVVAPRASRDGYLKGYSCGLNKGVREYQDDFIAKEAGKNLSPAMTSEIESGVQKYVPELGKRGADSKARQTVENRFRQSVTATGGKLPSSTPDQPPPEYSGFSNGYEKMNRSIPTAYEILKSQNEPAVDLYGFMSNGPSKLYIEDSQVYRPWMLVDSSLNSVLSEDPWNRRFGVDGFHRNTYRDWMLRLSLFPDAQDQARRLSPQQIEVHSTKPVRKPVIDPATGQQMVDANGQPVFETVQETVMTRLESPMEVYKHEFENAYREIAPRFYRRFFRTALDISAWVGYKSGERVGETLAMYKGQREAYNLKFEAESIPVYNSNYTTTYPTYFTNRYNDLKGMSVLERVIWAGWGGKVEDGILQPGESIRAAFNITNVGGQGSAIQISARPIGTGEVGTQWSASSQSILALQQKDIVTDYFIIAPALSKKQSSANLQVSFNIGGISHSQMLQIQNPVASETFQEPVVVDLNQGSITTGLKVSNPRSLAAGEKIEVNLYANNVLVGSQGVSNLGPKSQTDLTFTFQVDPLILIGNSISIRSELVVNGSVMQAPDAAVITVKSKPGIYNYWQAMMNNTAYLGQRDWNSQLDALIKFLGALNDAEIRYMVENKVDGKAWVPSKDVIRSDKVPTAMMMAYLLPKNKLIPLPTHVASAFDRLATELEKPLIKQPKPDKPNKLVDIFDKMKSGDGHRKEYQALVWVLKRDERGKPTRKDLKEIQEKIEKKQK